MASLARSFGAMIEALDERIAASQARLRELTGLAEIARLLTAVPSVHETADLLGERVCALVGSTAVAVWLPGEGPLPALYGGHGLPPEYGRLIRDIAADTENPGFETGAQVAMRTGEPVVRPIGGLLPDEVPSNHRAIRVVAIDAEWKSVAAVPMRIQDRVVGAMSCYFGSEEPLTPIELSLLTTIADQVAVAVENARLYAQSRDLAALEERQHLARELHDSVSQALYGIALGARTARTMLDRDPEKAVEPLEYVLAQAQAGLTEMRALIFELRPETIEKEGLVTALTKNVEALQSRHNIDVQANLGMEPDIPLAFKQTLHRIAQEALHNVVKHAGARHVTITLSCARGQIDLEIGDDGRGFDPGGAFPGHLGLRTMRERATRLGGTLEIESAPGAGTRLHLCVPVVLEGTAA